MNKVIIDEETGEGNGDCIKERWGSCIKHSEFGKISFYYSGDTGYPLSWGTVY